MGIVSENDIRQRTKEGKGVCIHYQTNGKIHQATIFTTIVGLSRDEFIKRAVLQLEKFYERQKEEHTNQPA